MTSDQAGAADRHIVLVGMMGSGKTTTGWAVAAELMRPMLDCDGELEARVGKTGSQVAATQGVDVLHELEEEVLLDALDEARPAVIAAAGWVVEAERCRDAMRERATVVWLDAPVEELLSRMATSDHRRSLERCSADTLLARRHVWLEELADLHLDSREPTETLVERIVAQAHGFRSKPG